MRGEEMAQVPELRGLNPPPNATRCKGTQPRASKKKKKPQTRSCVTSKQNYKDIRAVTTLVCEGCSFSVSQKGQNAL